MTEVSPDRDRSRQRRQRAVAAAPLAVLKDQWQKLGIDPRFTYLRGPETGLVSLRGCIGGGGAPFPFGDATATRTSVRLETGMVGHALILGRDRNRATIAALIDAISHDPVIAARIDTDLIEPLEQEITARDDKRARQTAATKVDFFTMVRGED